MNRKYIVLKEYDFKIEEEVKLIMEIENYLEDIDINNEYDIYNFANIFKNDLLMTDGLFDVKKLSNLLGFKILRSECFNYLRIVDGKKTLHINKSLNKQCKIECAKQLLAYYLLNCYEYSYKTNKKKIVVDLDSINETSVYNLSNRFDYLKIDKPSVTAYKFEDIKENNKERQYIKLKRSV